MNSCKQILFEFMDKWWSTPLILVALVVIAAVVFECWLGYRVRSEIKQMSDEELAQSVFEISWDYLKFIGLEHEPVKRFIELCETRDIGALCREWSKLETKFVSLERPAGHTGRPLIMDYYFVYGIYLKAYRKRVRSQRNHLSA